jgi:hypothetical protein
MSLASPLLACRSRISQVVFSMGARLLRPGPLQPLRVSLCARCCAFLAHREAMKGWRARRRALAAEKPPLLATTAKTRQAAVLIMRNAPVDGVYVRLPDKHRTSQRHLVLLSEKPPLVTRRRRLFSRPVRSAAFEACRRFDRIKRRSCRVSGRRPSHRPIGQLKLSTRGRPGGDAVQGPLSIG